MQFIITNSVFWLVNILLWKFDSFSKKKKKKKKIENDKNRNLKKPQKLYVSI